MEQESSIFKAPKTHNTMSFRYKARMIMKALLSTRNILLLMIYRHTLLKPKHNSVEDITNYMKIKDNLSSSGQPTDIQFSFIQKAGFAAVINLSTTDFIESNPKNEADLVTQLGMKYFHIPVDFSNPQQDCFDQFVNIMKSLSGENVWVHCLVNARASSFIYKYRVAVLGEDKRDALWDLREIWEPFGPWKHFVYGDELPAEK
jgi:protein tyrosine phosphatase (PTP) superfamily phosphohydrolase (DUF442 family)